jgi:hypothetical protein
MDFRVLAITLLLLAVPCEAQSTASAFLGILPKFPSEDRFCPTCQQSGPGDDPWETFHNQVRDALAQMDKVLRPLDQLASEAREQSARKKAEAMGLPPGSKGGKTLTPEQQKQIANQTLQAQFGANAPTAEELEKVKKMSPEAKKAWAMGFGTQVSADAQADPQKYRKASNASMANFKDLQRIQDLLRQIQGPAQKIRERMDQLTLEYETLATPRNPDGSDRNERRCEACRKILPQVVGVQQDYLDLIKKNFSTVNEIDDLQSKQMGMEKAPVPDLAAMHQVRAYVEGLPGAFHMFEN